MNWEIAKNTNHKAAFLAESGDISGALRAYVHGGSLSWSMKEWRKRRKAGINAKVGERHLARQSVDARIFYTAYRRFFLPNSIIS